MRAPRLTIVVIVVAAVGLAAFAFLSWQAVTIDTVTADAAREQFARTRASFRNTAPLFARDAAGRMARTEGAVTSGGTEIAALCALAYFPQAGKLVHARVPLWVWDLKAGAARNALRDTGFDIEQLGLTPADLRQLGPAWIFEESNQNGDMLLVWTE